MVISLSRPLGFADCYQRDARTIEETLFIDDSPRNCEVAQSLGIHTLCPHNNEDWVPMLKL